MTYEGVEYVVRIGIGRSLALLIYYPDKADDKPVVIKVAGTRDDANALARRKIREWLKNKKRTAHPAGSGARLSPFLGACRHDNPNPPKGPPQNGSTNSTQGEQVGCTKKAPRSAGLSRRKYGLPSVRRVLAT